MSGEDEIEKMDEDDEDYDPQPSTKEDEEDEVIEETREELDDV